MPTERREALLEHLDVQPFYEAPPAKPIECFAVSESELVAIGITYAPYREEEPGYRPNRSVAVYNVQGAFQYGLTFRDEAGFLLDWSGDDLLIYFTRDDILVSVNRDGVCTGAYNVPYTEERRLYEQELGSPHRALNGKDFYLEHKFGLLNYGRAVVKAGGNVTVLYDAASASVEKTVANISLFVLIFTVAGVSVLISIRKCRRDRAEKGVPAGKWTEDDLKFLRRFRR